MSKSITTIETTASKAIKPKPRKTEIIEALVQLRIQENAKINEAEMETYAEAAAFVQQRVKEYVIENIGDLLELRVWGNNVHAYVNVPQSKLPTALQFELDQLAKLPSGNRLPTHYGLIKDEIKRDFEGIQSKTERVKAMLADTETRKVLLEMLAIAEPKQAKLAA
jgi:hypothetical protein